MVLRSVAMAVGILASIQGLIAGLFIMYFDGYSSVSYLVFGLLITLTPSVVGLMGAGIVRNKPLKGSSLMAAACIILLCFSFSGIFSNVTVSRVWGFPIESLLMSSAALFLVGLILGIMGKKVN